MLQELEIMVERAKEYGVPIVALYTFQPDGRGSEGQSPLAVAQRLIEAGADVIGSNCGGGPELLYKVTTPMVELGYPVLAQANAGRPELIEGRSIYIANHEYFSVYTRRLLKGGYQSSWWLLWHHSCAHQKNGECHSYVQSSIKEISEHSDQHA